jgi:hypothetical protein
MRKPWQFSLCAALLTTLLFPPASGLAQSPVRECGGSAPPAWCAAAQGDRPSGWLRQGRSEVMARHGIVEELELHIVRPLGRIAPDL